jgi:prevent-host-death family protein
VAEIDRMASTDALRGKLSEAIGRARYAGRRTLLTVRGEPAAVVVSLTDLEHLERAILKAVPADDAAAPSKERD